MAGRDQTNRKQPAGKARVPLGSCCASGRLPASYLISNNSLREMPWSPSSFNLSAEQTKIFFFLKGNNSPKVIGEATGCISAGLRGIFLLSNSDILKLEMHVLEHR